jgi:hypothetical protein
VTEAQMKALFGAGRHPDADRIVAALTAAGTSEPEARQASRLGRPYATYEPLPPVEDRVAARVEAYETEHPGGVRSRPQGRSPACAT